MDGEADRLTMYGPIACEIRVQGVLTPFWSDRLGGLEITSCDRPRADDGAMTELRGELLDQAALLGVLTTLYDLGLPLLAVACAPATGRPTAGAGTCASGWRGTSGPDAVGMPGRRTPSWPRSGSAPMALTASRGPGRGAADAAGGAGAAGRGAP
jgi:hypothetical protein